MGSVWKRLQRVNKRAAKFQFTASYHELHLETTAKWRPSNLSVVWTRRSRRVASAPLPWEPDMMNPLIGCITWSVPDNHSISVTLFKDPRTHELEDKDWTFVLEDITQMGKKRVLASSSINMKKYASIESTQQSFTLTLKPISRKITSASLELTISCVFLREGKATDEDMQSVVSLMSVNNNCDVAPLDDLEDIPDLESTDDISDHLYDFTHQLEQLTTSLNGCMDLPTPLSVPSLSEDPTPLAEVNNVHFENNSEKPHIQEDESLKTPNAMNPILNNVLQKSTSVNSTTDNNKSSDDNLIQKEKQEIEIQSDSPRLIDTTTLVTSTPITKTDIKSTKTEYSAKKSLNFAPDAEASLENTNRLSINKNLESVLKYKTETKNNEQSNEGLLTTTSQITETTEKRNNQIKIDTSTKKELPNRIIDINSSQIFNAKSDLKRADLPPLNLRKNYELSYNQNLPMNSMSNNKPIEKVVLKEHTPGQDLLEWCKEVTRDYPNVKVTNLTTSWRNGMAFCAIIHHFEPNLIDMTKLSAHDVVGNCRNAFDAAETLGIPRVIEPRDMSLLAVPDKLAVMTYLHQLRAHFTGKQLQIEQIGPTSDESSYIIGNYKSDNVSQNLFSLNNLNDQLKNQSLLNDDVAENYKQQLSPTLKKETKNNIFTSSKNILGKVLSPSKEKYFINGTQHNNLSPDEEVEKYYSINSENSSVSTTQQSLSPIDSNTANRILSRHKEMSEKAKMMMEKLKISANNEKRENDDLRQQRLREQARRLILETRTKSPSDSPSTPTKLKRIHFTPERTISPIPNGVDEIISKINVENTDQFIGESSSNKVPTTPKKKITPPRDIDINTTKLIPSHKLSEQYKGSSHLQTFNAVMERISPKIEKKGDKVSYIESELEALEREQEAVDRKASNLEKKLRAVMGGNPKSEETEEQLLSQWFTLVNKKNALLRRQMQLNILEQESDLELKYTMLNQELRAAQSVEDWRKTEVQREKERLLLEELVSIVDKRDQLVQHLHSQEIAIEDDHEIARELEQVDISGNKEKCVIQ